MQRVRGLNILLVENETVIALDVSQLLAETDCTVIGPYAAVAEALQALARERIDCAILDINLGHEHSLHLADACADRAVPFIWMSGYSQTVLPRHRDRPFLNKPFVADELFAAIETAVRPRP